MQIFRVNPDVLAIEECDNFANFFEPALAKAGYEGAFVPKQVTIHVARRDGKREPLDATPWRRTTRRAASL